MEDGSTGARPSNTSSVRITSDVFEAYLKCPTKCWLRATDEPDSGYPYSEWVKTQNKFFRATETERLLAERPESEAARTPSPEYLKTGRWRLAVEVEVSTSALLRIRRREAAQASVTPPSILKSAPSNQSVVTSAAPGNGDDSHSAIGKPEIAVESLLHAVERVPSGGRGRGAQFMPIRFVSSNTLDRDDRLLLAFDAHVLAAALGREIAVGKIIHRDDHTALKVRFSTWAGEVRTLLAKIAALLASPAPPDLVLNRIGGRIGGRRF